MAKKKYPGVRERDGRFTFRYSVEVVDADGVRRRKQKETEAYPTAKAAYEAGILIKAQQLEGRLVDEKNITLEAWGERWLEEYTLERNVKMPTVTQRRTMLRCMYLALGSQTRVRDVTKAQYQKMLLDEKKKNLSRSRLIGLHSTCKMMFEDAARKEIIGESPTKGARVPSDRKQTVDINQTEEDELPRYLEKHELVRFLNTVRFRGDYYEHALFIVLAYTGMRLGELRALQWSDFDKDNGMINITKTLYSEGNRIKDNVFHTPKTKSSRRQISIGDTVIKALGLLKQKLRIERGIKDPRAVLTGFIFSHPGHPELPIPAQNVRNHLRKYLESAGLPTSLTPHSLRHTHVSLLAENPKVRLEEIQQRLGHKNDRVTREIYLHITKKRQHEIADDFEWVMES